MLLGVMAMAALMAPDRPTAPPAARASHCHADEAVLYSCRFGRRVGSVCGRQGAVHYRFGPPGRPEIDLASAADWSNVHSGHVVGQGGGYQSHLRISRGAFHYIVFHGQDGQLANTPGRTYSGISVVRGGESGRELAQLQCRGGEVGTDRLWEEALTPHLPAHLREVPHEPEGSHFDGWF